MTQENSQSEEEGKYGDTDVEGAESRDARDNAVENKLEKIDAKLDSIDESIETIEIQVAKNTDDLDDDEIPDVDEEDDAVEDDDDEEAGDTPVAALPEPTNDRVSDGWHGAPTPGDLVLITQGQTRKQLRNYSKKGVVMSVDMGESPDDTFYEVLFRSGSLSRYKEKNMVVFERRDSTPDTDTDRSIRAYFRESFGGVQ